jgi:hypothetical protein
MKIPYFEVDAFTSRSFGGKAVLYLRGQIEINDAVL